MDNNKKVTVVIPYYKGMETVFNTINSVIASEQLCDELNIEYILIIDSMEDKKEIAQKIKGFYGKKIRIIENEKNIGVAESRNKALKEADFDYILFLDQDDFIDKNYFSLMNKGIKENADLIVSNAYVINSNNKKKVKMYNKKPNLSFNDFLKGNKILTPGQVMFSKKVARIENLFTGCSVEFKGADDWASYINIFIKYGDVKVYYVKEPVFYYNIHENNYSKNWKEINMSAIKTAEFFINKVSKSEENILRENIEFLIFENKYKDKNYKFNIKDFTKIIKYYSYNVFDYNKITHFINKKLIGFNR
ncbi:glycosyltransferase family 2 protein [Clostridium sp.]|uniref:glycosyltransferase family 2 protein n=1 Tax=Clostridium sp. TaxID=1506 RepID=UPI00399380CF